MSEIEGGPAVDILILHGKAPALVKYLCDFFGAIGLSAHSAVELPSLGHAQEPKVDYYIERCGSPLVLATVDEDNGNANQPRQNVIDELARCRLLRGNDTVVLRELRGNLAVSLPSNVEGQVVVLPFQRERLDELATSLLREVASRHIVRKKTYQNMPLIESGASQHVSCDRSFFFDLRDKLDPWWSDTTPKVTHIVVEMVGIRDMSGTRVRRAVAQILDRLNLHPVDNGGYEYTFPNNGFTFVQLLKESHIACHVWPERGYMHVDIVTCTTRSYEVTWRFIAKDISAVFKQVFVPVAQRVLLLWY